MEFDMNMSWIKWKNVNLVWNDRPIVLKMEIENFFQIFLDWNKQDLDNNQWNDS
jgi:hypothetical protein